MKEKRSIIRNDYTTFCDFAKESGCSKCKVCSVKKEIDTELKNNLVVTEEIINQIDFNNKSNNIQELLIKEVLENIKNGELQMIISNLDTQFALLTLLGLSPKDRNKIYQREISLFFNLIQKFQKEINITIDILGDELTKKTLINLAKITRQLGFTDTNLYLINKESKEIVIKNINIKGDFSIEKIELNKKNIENLSYNVRKLLLEKDNKTNLKVTNIHNYLYSDSPIEGIGEDIAILLPLKDEGLNLIIGFDDINNAISTETIGIIETFINAIENRLFLFESVRDDLTGLLRRKNFIEEILKKGPKGSFLIFDIDNFKSINDQFGHNVGDEVIKAVASVLSSNVKRDKDLVCRWGGEEFVIFLPNVNDTKAVKDIYERIKNVLKKVSIKKMGDKKITLSAGAIVDTTDNNSKEKILENIGKADAGLYYSKENGKDQLTLFRELESKKKENKQ